jgi:FkbM family methyltransferase
MGLHKKIKKYLNFLIKPQNFYIHDKKHFNYHNLSFSQEGEDRILARIFENKEKGFYIDIGAHHPQRFSNTYYFYLRGWRGINIDAMPGSMKTFNEIRPDDINLEFAISSQSEKLTYYMFDEPALNSFSKLLSEQRDKRNRYKIVESREINTYRLDDILNQYLPKNKNIDFMNIDVEGYDQKVLESNDWNKYQPLVILIEDLDKKNLHNREKSEIISFLINHDYQLYAKSVNTLIFMKS